MYSNTLVHLLLYKVGLTPASIILNSRQRLYVYRLLSFFDQYSIKKILLISLRIKDRTFQPKELPDNNLCRLMMLDPPYMSID